MQKNLHFGWIIGAIIVVACLVIPGIGQRRAWGAERPSMRHQPAPVSTMAHPGHNDAEEGFGVGEIAGLTPATATVDEGADVAPPPAATTTLWTPLIIIAMLCAMMLVADGMFAVANCLIRWWSGRAPCTLADAQEVAAEPPPPNHK